MSLALLGLLPQAGQAAIVYLENGDRLSGRIVREDEARVTLQHHTLGTVTFSKTGVMEIVRDEPPEAIPAPEVHAAQGAAAEWTREISAGYNTNRGNTDNEQLSGGFLMNRKTVRDKWTAKAAGDYAASSQRMDAQRFGGLLRYAFSFGKRLAWYTFYKVEGEHDRFANIDWRVIPSSGIGYWFSDREAWKAMVEVGLGWERTAFRDATPGRSDLVLVPRGFFQKTLYEDTILSTELIAWPNLGAFGEYRIQSETVLDNPLTEGLSFRLNLIDRFESDPAEDADRNDLRLLSSFVYSF